MRCHCLVRIAIELEPQLKQVELTATPSTLLGQQNWTPFRVVKQPGELVPLFLVAGRRGRLRRGGSGASGGDAGRGPATGVDVPPDAQAAAAEGGVTGPAIAASGAATAANETLCAGALGGGAAAFAATGAATTAGTPRPKRSSNNGTGGTPSELEADRRERDPKCASAFDNADFTDLDEE